MKTTYLFLLLIHSTSSFAALTKQEFRATSDLFLEYIVPKVQNFRADYQRSIKLIESKPGFGVYATEPIQVYMGTLTSKHITTDAYALILCHEIGHDLKIVRHFMPEDYRYAFSHLEQDYFAAKACILPFFEKHPRILSNIELSQIPLGLQTKCEIQGRDTSSKTACLRAIIASKLTIDAVHDHRNFYSTYEARHLPAPSLERQWIENSDRLQARLITFINGIFGDLPFHPDNI